MVVCQFETLHVHLIANFQNIVYTQVQGCLWKVADRLTVWFRKKSELLLENDNYLRHFMQFYVTHLWLLGAYK